MVVMMSEEVLHLTACRDQRDDDDEDDEGEDQCVFDEALTGLLRVRADNKKMPSGA